MPAKENYDLMEQGYEKALGLLQAGKKPIFGAALP